MECRPLDVTLISATELKDVNLLSKMDVYAVVSISSDSNPMSKQKTPVDKDSGPNPRWNHTARFTVPEHLTKGGQAYLKIKIFSDRSFGDKEIGEVQIPISELAESHGESEKRMSYSVRLPSGKSKGTLNIAYKFGEKFTAAAPEIPKAAPVMAFPAASHAGPSYAYPPPQQPGQGYAPPPGYSHAPPPAGYGYAPPPAPGYGYAPPPPGYGYAAPPPGYGYAPPHQQKPKRNGGNMALGLGAGLLGGLLIGDMVSDVGDYDGGFDGGFDF